MDPYRILMVDDDPFALQGSRVVLEAEGYQVTTAERGEQALGLLSQESFHLVITDLVMGGANGIDVLRGAKTAAPATQVIILTGHGDLASAIEAIRLKADDYLLKPSSAEELLFRTQRCLRSWELSRRVKLYEKILPVCVYCKRIRDDDGVEPGAGVWLRLEEYLSRKAGLLVSHGCCPECEERVTAEIDGSVQPEG